jgi:tRNA/rRNA methyltransferase/tRNA (cytidine32/uridine32-2'-O)-methyltransferase
MKNMGLSQLRLAGYESSQRLDAEQILARAVHSEDVWKNARFFENLSDAIADCSFIAGTTRRRGQNRKNISMPPRALAQQLAERPGPAAIVFGNERTGLEDAELELCNAASHIPASEVHPSLNLSHAVQVYAYELFLALGQPLPVKGEWQAMNQAEIASLVDSITGALEKTGFYRYPNREYQARFLRDFISRAGLSESEGRYFKEILTKAALFTGV